MSPEKKPMGPAQQVEETVYAQPGVGRNRALLFGVLGPPLAWALLLTVLYALVASDCEGMSRALLLGLCAATLAVSLAGGLVAHRMYRGLREAPGARVDPVAGRERFMALSGMLLSLLFALLIVATAIPHFFLRTCD
jgi:hypothetical protein